MYAEVGEELSSDPREVPGRGGRADPPVSGGCSFSFPLLLRASSSAGIAAKMEGLNVVSVLANVAADLLAGVTYVFVGFAPELIFMLWAVAGP